MRIRAYRVLRECVADFLTGSCVVLHRLPEGIKVVRFAYDFMTDSAIVFVEHSSFEEHKEGEIIDIRDLYVRRPPQ